MYDINITTEGCNLKELSDECNMPIPYNWNNEQNTTIFDQACFGIIPDVSGH